MVNLSQLGTWVRSWAAGAKPAGTAEADDAEIQAALRDVGGRLPQPVFWLLGKTQSGKSSIVRTLTGSSAAEIGQGFRACTKTARIFSFPDEQQPLVRFLDTRGLGEVSYDPQEDLAQFAGQSHLVLVVMKAMDHAQAPVIEALARIRSERRDWPIVVAQTSLHEGYDPPTDPHATPYPYHLLDDPSAPKLPDDVPRDLVRSILKQRELFAGMNARFVPLDFTLPEDGFEPADYGVEYLWETIDKVLPLGLSAVMRQSPEVRNLFRDARFRRANGVIMTHAALAGAAAMVPIPGLDIPVVVSIQASLCRELAKIYEQPMDSTRLMEIAGSIGAGWLGRLGVRELAKFIPWIGSPLSGAYAAGGTYALGRTLCAYFTYIRNGDVPSTEQFRKMFEQQESEGRKVMQDYIARMGKLRTARTEKPPEKSL